VATEPEAGWHRSSGRWYTICMAGWPLGWVVGLRSEDCFRSLLQNVHFGAFQVVSIYNWQTFKHLNIFDQKSWPDQYRL